MWWHASTYGIDSFMNRLPAMFTMIEPGELRSDSANHGAVGQRAWSGPHDASSIIIQCGTQLLGGDDAVAGVGRSADGPVGR